MEEETIMKNKILMKCARRVVFFALFAAFACTASSCSLFEASANRDKLKNLRVGMTRDQVRKIMGDPLEKEIYHRPFIWYYFTNPKWFDGVNTRDECTPVVFDENTGHLIGWGYDFFKTYMNEDPWRRRQLDPLL